MYFVRRRGMKIGRPLLASRYPVKHRYFVFAKDNLAINLDLLSIGDLAGNRITGNLHRRARPVFQQKLRQSTNELGVDRCGRVVAGHSGYLSVAVLSGIGTTLTAF